MLKTRIIPCLDVKDGRVVKGVNFVGLRDAGDPVEAAKAYDAAGADELCFLASGRRRQGQLQLRRRRQPGRGGRGRRPLWLAMHRRGAGRQDHRPGKWELFTAGGRKPTGLDAVDFAKMITAKGAGEILLTSMDRDGTREGFNLPLTRAISDAVSVPVIASGGVGNLDHLVEGVTKGGALLDRQTARQRP